MSEISRRDLLAGLGVGVAAALPIVGAGCTIFQRAAPSKGMVFYGADGKFNEIAAKRAYFDMMKRFNYPITPTLREGMWVAEFALGKFNEVGMAGIFWINEKEGNYFGHEIYLLPGQMIPEHWHVKTEDAGPKMEAWQVRYGMAYLYGEGPATPGVEARIPASQKEFVTARSEKVLHPGEITKLAKAEAKHWMLAGPKGVIVTEYATYHDSKGLRFSNPNVKF